MLQFIAFASVLTWLNAGSPFLLALLGTIIIAFANIQGGKDATAMAGRRKALREARRRDRSRGGIMLLVGIGAAMAMLFGMGRKAA